MTLVQNFPTLSIMFLMFAAIFCSVLSGKIAMKLTNCVLFIVAVMQAFLVQYMYVNGGSYVIVMGRFPAPWGNELRVGALEALLGFFFSVIMILSLTGGIEKIRKQVTEDKINLYYVLINLIFASILALVYTNDMFTAYVFVEINTISAAGLIMIRQNERTIEAAVRYMIMSLLGSGLLLMGICMLYSITGHLLMSNVNEGVNKIIATQGYTVPLYTTIVLVSVGLCIKSALFPFHAWLPNAYGYSTISSSAILSSIVSKGYIVLLLKIIYRVIGFDNYVNSEIVHVLFIFGLAAMIFGSISAIGESDIRRMIAFSSVAQIGYIYAGIGMGTTIGIVAAVFHILTHAATKSLLFISASGLQDASGNSRSFFDLTGSGLRNKMAGAGFFVGSLAMVGIPMFSGFVSKIQFSISAINSHKIIIMIPMLVCLAISTILNAIYFMKTVLRIYTPEGKNSRFDQVKSPVSYSVTIIIFIIVNVFLGVCSSPVISLIEDGIRNFGG